ncbi:serine protease [Amycolatopsis sp. PS_44_ISF1]|uniref:trypsin-like serine peptidase n=1 Tax=Amycolatopsis sp. PS_44_ISF1 TaxID=2974917 RepID=UPI0028DE5B87|nr:serine protease [Amycolatopsis sp. PS_44_ISF1]MDT8910233.1 serine protease [Amycolatopsis sp. PS_44_ISF1]
MRRARVVVTIGTVVVLSTTGTVVAGAGHRLSPADSTPRLRSSEAVGALFLDGTHYCTASVVHSGRGDELLTAAHCLHDGEGGDYIAGVTFAPGYHDGVAPLGFWDVADELVAPGWSSGSDPNLDVGFATAHQAGSKQPIEAVTGANRLGTGRPFAQPVRVTGYPESEEVPAVCATDSTRQDEHQLRVDCPGFATGTSGGPWVVDRDPATNLGTVIGVVGGYEYGGDTDDVSYSSYFGDDVAELYRQATSRP